MIQLRPQDQIPVVQAIRNAYAEGKRCPMLVASTGFGKTVVFSYITHGAYLKENPVLVIAHRKEIIRQISASLARFGVMHQVIASAKTIRSIKVAHFKKYGRSFVSDKSPVMVASVQTAVPQYRKIEDTIKRYPGKKPLIVMDEGHHVVENTQWGHIMDYFHVQGALGLVVTATPERLDGKGLGKGHGGYADVMIEAPPMSWLIGNGMLSPYEAFIAPEEIDMRGVGSRKGEFISKEAAERVNKPNIIGNAIEHYKKYAAGMRAVAFCVSIEISKDFCRKFNEAGIPSAHIDGDILDEERDKAIEDFAAGKIFVLFNVNLISEGFDLAAIAGTDVTIDCIIDLSPTQSLVTAMQRWGRALRYVYGKTAILLDHASNILRHGFPDDEREWSLEGRKKSKRKKSENEEDVKIQTCPECFAIHKPASVCPKCGHQYQLGEGRKVEQIEGSLQRVTPEQREARRLALEVAKKERIVSEAKARSFAALVELGESRGYQFPIAWAKKRAAFRCKTQEQKDALAIEIQEFFKQRAEHGATA